MRVVVLCMLLGCMHAHAQPFSTPNIIFIMADDLGYGDLSCYGRKDYTTPNLDKLASQGIRFLHAYSASALCTPTRVAFMTGRYPARLTVGLYEPLRANPKDSAVGLSPDVPSVSRYLKKAGYETALIGKWHLGLLPEHAPRKHGFDYFFGFHGAFIDYTSHASYNKTLPNISAETRVRPAFFENETRIKKEGYATDILTDQTIKYLSQKRKKPFFLSLQFNTPHWPWQRPGDPPYHDTMDWRAGGSPAIFASMIKSLDEAVGKILKALEQNGLAKNTVIIFTSDNGGERFSNMEIYSGRKRELYEGGIRVPAFVKWPGKIVANTTTNQVAVTMDWTATILALAGAKPDKGSPPDGQNLIPILTGKQKDSDRTLYWRMFQDGSQKALRHGRWKYLANRQGEFLFDLNDDPSEKKDLKDQEPTVFAKLKAMYEDWEKTMLTPIPL